MSILIKNARVITLDSENSILEDACVYIKDGIIESVGAEPGVSADRCIDAAGKTVLPGFVNTHTHLPMNLFRSYADDMPLMTWLEEKIWPSEARMDETAVYYGAMAALAEMAMGGVTAFADAYYLYDWYIEAIRKSGMRALIGRSVVDTDYAEGERKFSEMLDMRKNMRGGRVDVGFAAHAVYTCSPSMLRRIAEAAAGTDVIIQVHASETASEVDGCMKANGTTPIRLLKDTGILDSKVIAAHCVWPEEEEIELLASGDVTVSHCPSSNMKLASGIAPVPDMKKKGVNIALGTDSASSNNALSVWREMTECALIHKADSLDATAVDAPSALRMATVNGAKAMNLNSGTIEKGKNADLIMIDTSGIRYAPACGNTIPNIVYSGTDSDVCMTMVGGDILYENGEVTFCDIDECMAKMKEFIQSL